MDSIKTSIPDVQSEIEEKSSSKGTVASLGILAAVIVIMWLAVYWLYMGRV